MASTSDQFFYLDSPNQFEEWVDFDQFLDLPSAYGNEYSASASTNSVSPDMALPYDAEMLGADLLDFSQSTFPDMIDYDASQDSFFADLSPEMGMLSDQPAAVDDSTLYSYPQYDASFDFRQLVEAQAAADPRIASIKEKRREAAIELHLQRLCEATARDLDMSSDSNTSFSSPAWSDYVRGSNSPQSASASASPKTPSACAPNATSSSGGVEMVLDLNMNAAANLPKKQKPRSQAQKENYIKARKYGACEKHKKQHKRCNCLEKAAARMGVNEVPMNVAYRERPQQTVHSSPDSPASRVSGVPGHDRQSVSPRVRPLPNISTGEALKKAVNNSPGHDVSANPSGGFHTTFKRTSGVPGGHGPQFSVSPYSAVAKQGGKLVAVQSEQAVNAKRNSSGVRGHDPQYSASVFLTPVKAASKNVVSPGQNVSHPTASVTQPVQPTLGRGVPQSYLRGATAALSAVKATGKTAGSLEQGAIRQSSSIVPQTVKATNRRDTGQTNLRWRVVGFSPTTDTRVSRDNTSPRQTTPASSISKSGITRSPYLDARRPQDSLSSLRVNSNASSTTPASTQTQAFTLSKDGRKSGNTNVLATNNTPLIAAGFQKPLDIVSTRAKAQGEASSQDCRLEALGQTCRGSNVHPGRNRLVAQSISTQLGGLFSSTMAAIAGIGLSSSSAVSWSEQSISKCMSRLGSQLMSVRRFLQSSLI